MADPQLNIQPDHVTDHTPAHLNRRIARRTEANVAYFRRRPDRIDQRLAELDREWDIERTLQANASSLILLSLTLSFLINRRYALLGVVVAGFLLQHAIQGWCPPIRLFRRLGVRTRSEILFERTQLEAIRRQQQAEPATDSLTTAEI